VEAELAGDRRLSLFAAAEQRDLFYMQAVLMMLMVVQSELLERLVAESLVFA
jgi:hypothetical protein